MEQSCAAPGPHHRAAQSAVELHAGSDQKMGGACFQFRGTSKTQVALVFLSITSLPRQARTRPAPGPHQARARVYQLGSLEQSRKSDFGVERGRNSDFGMERGRNSDFGMEQGRILRGHHPKKIGWCLFPVPTFRLWWKEFLLLDRSRGAGLAQTKAAEPALIFQAFCALFGPKRAVTKR